MKVNPGSNDGSSGNLAFEHSNVREANDAFGVPVYPSSYYLEEANLTQQSGWQRYLVIPPILRTWLTNTMIYLERIMNYFFSLRAEDITEELQSRLASLGPEIEMLLHDFQSPYFENGSLSTLGLERIQNMLWREKKGSILRLNINMTDANKIDPSGNLGTAYRYSVISWLQNEFGVRQVSQNPEGTSFLVIDVPSHRMRDSLGRFEREIKIKLRQRGVQQQYHYNANILSRFQPTVTGMFMELSAEELDINETLSVGDRQMILDLQDKIIARIEHSLRVLAVGTNIAEKDPASVGLVSGLMVYNAADLPLFSDSDGFDAFRKALELGLGYVPASVYWSPLVNLPFAPREAPNLTMRRRPRVGHNYGFIDHPVRLGDEGGALQMLLKGLGELAGASTLAEKDAALNYLEIAVGRLGKILDLGLLARSNARNPALIKWRQRIKFHDGTRSFESYFLEEVALRPEENVHIAVMEIDSFKAFSATHRIDEVDSNFWGVFDQFFWVAKKMGIRPPVLTQVGGDLVAVAIPTQDMQGEAVDLAEYVEQVQLRVAKIYSDRPFQDYAKVTLPNGNGVQKVERWPLWVVDDQYVPSLTRPENGEPYIRTLSISIAATTINTPQTAQDKRNFFTLISDLAERVEVLKERSSPQKGTYEIVEPGNLSQTAQLILGGFAPRTEETSITGFYTPASQTVPEDEMFQNYVDALSGGFEAAWGQSWSGLPPSIRMMILNNCGSHFYNYADGAFMPVPSVIGTIPTLFGYPSVSLPAQSIIMMPPVIPIVTGR